MLIKFDEIICDIDLLFLYRNKTLSAVISIEELEMLLKKDYNKNEMRAYFKQKIFYDITLFLFF